MKKLCKPIICTIFVVTIILVLTISVVAQYNMDTYAFKFDYIAGGTAQTDYMTKTDCSYMYIQVDSSPYSIYVYPIGSKQYVSGVQQGPCEMLSQGEYKYLTNYVFENGFTQGAIRGDAAVHTLYSAVGVWTANSGIGTCA